MRLSKKQKTLFIVFFSLLLFIATLPAAIWVTHTQTAELGNARTRCDQKPGTNHFVIIQRNVVTPANTEAKKCDTLTVTNLDDKQRLLAFGEHDKHISYDGISEKLVGQNQSLDVTLIRTGTYLFHDHEQAIVRGSFTVR